MSSARHAKPRTSPRSASRTAPVPAAADRRGGGGRHRAPAKRAGLPAPAAVGAAVVAVAAGASLVPDGGEEPTSVAAPPPAAAEIASQVATDLGAPGVREADRASRRGARAVLPERAPVAKQADADVKAARERARDLLDEKVREIAKAAERAAAEAVPRALDKSGCGYDPDSQRRPQMSAEQLRNVRAIVRVAKEMGLPPRAAVIALATAQQESWLKNLNWGDRDSLGLFQQRPSMGWGSARQVRDPEYAARAFFRALKDVDGWEKLPLSVAAQRVQRSAFPWAYARWELMAAELVRDQLDVAADDLNCAR